MLRVSLYLVKSEVVWCYYKYSLGYIKKLEKEEFFIKRRMVLEIMKMMKLF